jgi:hypothetical protein
MTVTAKCLLEAKYAEDSQTTQYTTPGGTRTIIDKFTATGGAAGGTLTVNLVASAGTAGASNLVLTKTLTANETYTCPEVVGQVLNAGGFISTDTGGANTVVIRISGRENT